MSGAFDASEFLRGLNLADARVQRGARRAIAKCLAEVERRAKKACPIQTGTLMASITAHIGEIEVTADHVRGLVSAGGGEASDYAVVQHEDVLHHTYPTVGEYAAKYIEKPLTEMARLMNETMAREIRQELAA